MPTTEGSAICSDWQIDKSITPSKPAFQNKNVSVWVETGKPDFSADPGCYFSIN